MPLHAPNYTLEVSGQPVPDDVLDYIKSVKFEDSRDMANLIQIQLANPMFRFTDSKLFAEGNSIQLWLGFGSSWKFMDECTITKWLPRFPQTGLPTMVVKAYGYEFVFMRRISKGEQFKKHTASEVVNAILARNEYAPYKISGDVTETDAKKNFVIKKGESDWKALKKMARMNGFDLYVDADPGGVKTLYFGPPKDKDSSIGEFVYGDEGAPNPTLLTFQPKFDTSSQPTGLIVVAYDRRAKKVIRIEIVDKGKEGIKAEYAGTVDDPADPIESGASMSITAHNEMTHQIRAVPFSSADEAARFAANWWRENQESFITANATFGNTELIEEIRAKKVLTLGGIGERLSGDWYVDKCTHNGGRGSYTVSAALRKIYVE